MTQDEYHPELELKVYVFIDQKTATTCKVGRSQNDPIQTEYCVR
jgi:hypothetical protein